MTANTPGFEHDIFISFSHTDNLAREGANGWIDRFREELEIWLIRRALKDLSIWWDKEKLRGNTNFDARIEDCLSKTALLVVVHSRNYCPSDYCLGSSTGSFPMRNGIRSASASVTTGAF